MTKTHMERITHRPNVTVTGTLCNRMSDQGEINSTGNQAEVTCKFCLRIMNSTWYRRAA
jgi:hypothetical protein